MRFFKKTAVTPEEINRQRWEIEENFRIMKTEFEARTELTDTLHRAFRFRADYEFITRSSM